MNTKPHAVADAQRRPIRLVMTAGQVSDYIGAAAMSDSLYKADWLLAEKGYDADRLRNDLKDNGIGACIPGRKSRSTLSDTTSVDTKAETAFGRLKEWRRVATRYDRCTIVFLSTVALAATVIFWL
jgi:transposase